ncbi:NUDIX hydrolase [Kitasatospora cystarginea]|uniref:NUDIX hydrolase n=1 Tax=Kitasatospora cystarginea TaxID=58350 RepID=A0ABN3EQV6_9ACTN
MTTDLDRTGPNLSDALAQAAHADGIEHYGAGCAIIHEGRVLLIRRRPDDSFPGMWELPSGGVDLGEDIEDAARREAAEETGLTVRLTGYLGHFDFTNSKGAKARQFTFAATADKTDPIILTEHDAHQWAHPEQLPLVTPEVLRLIQSAAEAS